MLSESSKESFIRLDFSSLMSHATGNETTSRLDERGIDTVCYIINTADYCQENCEAMESEVRRQLEEPYSNQVDLSDEQGRFYKVLKTCIETLVMSAMNAVEPELSKIPRINWATYETVGDQSSYVSAITMQLREYLPGIANRIPRNHFKFLCDNLVLYVSNPCISDGYWILTADIISLPSHSAVLLSTCTFLSCTSASEFPLLVHSNSCLT